MNTATQKTGKQRDGRIIMDCGCWVNTLMQYRCQLHTAAPDLLAALEKATRQYRAFVDQCCKGEDNRMHERYIAECVAAINKAKGQ